MNEDIFFPTTDADKGQFHSFSTRTDQTEALTPASELNALGSVSLEREERLTRTAVNPPFMTEQSMVEYFH